MKSILKSLLAGSKPHNDTKWSTSLLMPIRDRKVKWLLPHLIFLPICNLQSWLLHKGSKVAHILFEPLYPFEGNKGIRKLTLRFVDPHCHVPCTTEQHGDNDFHRNVSPIQVIRLILIQMLHKLPLFSHCMMERVQKPCAFWTTDELSVLLSFSDSHNLLSLPEVTKIWCIKKLQIMEPLS